MMRWVRDLVVVSVVVSAAATTVSASTVLVVGEVGCHDALLVVVKRLGITKEEAPGKDADSIKATSSANGECCIVASLQCI
jgi:collagenase-like PrtC family protease